MKIRVTARDVFTERERFAVWRASDSVLVPVGAPHAAVLLLLSDV